jgi:hypothetical protein
MRYNVNEEPPCSDLFIFASRGTIVGTSTSYYSTPEGREASLLYMYANIDGMNKYFKCLLCIYVNQHAFILFRKI